MKNKRVLFLTVFILAMFTFSISASGAEKAVVAKKKIVFLKDDNGQSFNGFAAYIGTLIEKKGYTKENSEYIALSMEGNLKTIPKVIADIKRIKPDVMLMNGAFGLKEITTGLKKSGIPIVVGINVDYEENRKYIFIDKDNNPLENVTGMYTLSKDYEKRMFGLMDFAVPLKDKKVVMIMPKFWQKHRFTDALAELKMPLKKYETPRYWEDAKKMLLKYNEDKEVGWIIMDNAFETKDPKDKITIDQKHRWIAENSKKPGFAMYQLGVENGQLLGIAHDSMGTVALMVDMGDRILKGTKVKDIKAEYPPRSFILLNIVTANKLGLILPLDMIYGSWRVYTDYEGHFEGHK